MNPLLNFHYYLFDWDGCLADTPGIWLDAYKKIYAEYGLQVTEEDILRYSWGNLKEGPRHFGIKNIDETWDKILNEVQDGARTVKLHPHVPEMLAELTKFERKVAIVSSSESSLIQPALYACKIEQFISITIGANQVEKHKPNPECIERAMSYFRDKEKSKYIIIGDTDKDIQTGKNAGIATALYKPEQNAKYYGNEAFTSSSPDFVIRNFSELLG